MIDLHSHILPKVDDGSRSAEESLKMLSLMASQGVERVATTPHFLPTKETISNFLERRNQAFSNLIVSQELPTLPHIHLGAEVAYYEGISKLNDLTSLCISESNLLLMEMPIAKWSDYTVHEIMDLACLPKTQIVLAHVERYRELQNKEVWQQLLSNDILMQVNASYFLRFSTRRKGVQQLQDCEIHFLGSDCHDLKIRPPQVREAYQYIERKLGSDFVSSIVAFGHSFFNHPLK